MVNSEPSKEEEKKNSTQMGKASGKSLTCKGSWQESERLSSEGQRIELAGEKRNRKGRIFWENSNMEEVEEQMPRNWEGIKRKTGGVVLHHCSQVKMCFKKRLANCVQQYRKGKIRTEAHQLDLTTFMHSCPERKK